MAKKSRKPSAPLTFDLPESLITRIETCRRGHGFKTASEVVRTAIAGYDFDTPSYQENMGDLCRCHAGLLDDVLATVNGVLNDGRYHGLEICALQSVFQQRACARYHIG